MRFRIFQGQQYMEYIAQLSIIHIPFDTWISHVECHSLVMAGCCDVHELWAQRRSALLRSRSIDPPVITVTGKLVPLAARLSPGNPLIANGRLCATLKEGHELWRLHLRSSELEGLASASTENGS